MSATAQAGCLLVLNNQGKVVETFSGSRDGAAINGPWDMTALDVGNVAELFVTNVLNGTVAGNGGVVSHGTVVRMAITSPDDKDDGKQLADCFVDSSSGPASQKTGPDALGNDESSGDWQRGTTLRDRAESYRRDSECGVQALQRGERERQFLRGAR